MKKFSAFSLSLVFMIIFGAKKLFHFVPMGHDLFYELALASDSTAIDHTSRDSFSACAFHVSCFRRKKISKTLPTSFIIQRVELKEKLFARALQTRGAVFMKHFQGGHVMKCKQIS
jgi:hypothetical protein